MYKPSLYCFIYLIYSTQVFSVDLPVDKLTQVHSKNISSQQRIDQSESTRLSNVQAYLVNERQALLFEKYNTQLAKVVQSQEVEIAELSQQISSIAETEQSILPMLADMINTLDTFITQDLPFLPQERQQRMQRLKRIVERADISTAEKYRQILDTYMLEVNYGRSLDAYRGPLLSNVPNKNTDKQVDYFRFGRMSLYYQTLDGSEGGFWLPNEQQWQSLDQSQLIELKQAILVAKKLKAPQLLTLPLPLMDHKS